MISLLRLNGKPFVLNAVHIEQVESLPDTTITLISGKKLVVRNAEEEVIQMVTNYYQKIGLQCIHRKTGDDDE